MVGQPGPGIDHRVDRAASAEHLAAWPVQAPILQLALLASLVGPIEASIEQLGKGGRHFDLQLAVLWPGLQQQHPCTRVSVAASATSSSSALFLDAVYLPVTEHPKAATGGHVKGGH